MTLALLPIALGIALSPAATDDAQGGYFWSVVNSTFKVCPAVIAGQIDLKDETARALAQLKPATASEKKRLSVVITDQTADFATAKFPDGSVVVAATKQPTCVVQFDGPSYSFMSDTVAEQLDKNSQLLKSGTIDGANARTYRRGKMEITLLSNPATKSAMAKFSLIKE